MLSVTGTLESLEELRQGDGLGEIVVRFCSHALFPILVHGESGQRHDLELR
jgi:hypothetical protein